MTMEEIMRMATEKGTSDIHIIPENPLMFRIGGALIPQTEQPLSPEDVIRIMRPVITDEQIKTLEAVGEIDFAFALEGYPRVRVNLFSEKGKYGAALRILATKIPEPQMLGIPKAVTNLTTLRRGLVLVTGATGSGKSTTLASLLNMINERDARNTITLEDPIEYIHHPKCSVVSQREVGEDTQSYANGLRAALRQDPDVILVGEMRDLETISIAITAAETGHLVCSTLHTNSAADAIDRMIDVFPPHQQQQIRIQLANVLECVVAQQLLPRKDQGRVAAYEVMISTYAIRNLIREGKTYQIPSMMQTGKGDGMAMMDDAIAELYQRGLVDKNTAMLFSHDPNGMMKKLGNYS